MKEQFIKNAQQVFLKDTIQFFNLGNRCSTQIQCQYAPKPFSPGCAIGRHVPNITMRMEWDKGLVNGKVNHGPGLSAWGRDDESTLGSLSALGIFFLTECQGLHDTGEYWDCSGLSDAGRIRARQICGHFGLDSNQVLGEK